MNEWEARGRLVKARKLAALISRAMQQHPDVVTIERLAAADDGFWQVAAREAGVKVPSAETRAWTLEILREQQMPASRSRTA